MELDIDLPNYLYNKPDGYYAKDIIQNRDETIEELKSDAKKLKDRLFIFSTFRPLDTEFKFFNEMSSIKGEIKFIPKKFSAVNNMGRIYKGLTCDIVFKDLNIGDGEFYHAFRHPQFKDFSETFEKEFKKSSGRWEHEFNKLSKLIGMEDYQLRIDDIIFEHDE